MTVVVDVNRIGALISSLGSPCFGAQYFDLFSSGLGIDQCTVFAFRGAQPPDPLVMEGKSLKMRQIAHSLAQEYMAGAFVQDPNVHRGQSLDVPTVHCLRADQVQDRTYRLRFYDQPKLAHELVVLGQSDDILYYSSFYRSDRRAAFKPSELEMMTGMANLAVRALHRHLELLGGSGLQSWKAAAASGTGTQTERRKEMAAHLRDVLLAEPYALSQREAEVCSGIILGYTTLGISLNFGISVNTVATHRKRAYRKLGICSQNELFSRYFQVVNQHTGQSADKALAANA
ncbi:MAG TPA: helix-turn-helix transcriptional regulator [Steroidobacteraceae bacterium]|nr:helix-turn-helix transcriptional regulator [Steroidobacteraceae bacterium]